MRLPIPRTTTGARSVRSGTSTVPAPAVPAFMLLAAGLLAGLLAGLAAPSAAQTFPEPPPIEATRAPERPVDYAPGVDVLHYDLEIGVGETVAGFAGRARIRVVAERNGPVLPLDLTGLAVDDVGVDRAASAGDASDAPSAAVPGARYADGVLHVPLPDARAGDTVTVTVAYSGTPDDALNLGPNVHGAPSAFADNWPNRARYWFPSVDHPSDKATVRFTIHAPAAWQVVANGHLAAEPAATAPDALGPHDGPRRTWVWQEDVPIPTYTMVLGAAEMVTRPVARAACGAAPAARTADGCVEVSWWAFPADTAHAARVFRRAGRMVDYFTELVGPFPYEKLAHVQSGTRFGGMENASAIFYAGAALARGRLGEGTVVHETAHQWFGDAVTERSWSHLWLSEGFATYFTALFFEHVDGVAARDRLLEQARRRILGSDVSDRPVVDRYADLYDLLNTNSYQKGGWVLHMLRGLLGDDAFFRGIRAYYAAHRNGTALTGDLRAAMEEASGRELATFFRQWLFEPGYPVLEVRHAWHPSGDGGTVEVTVRQTQKAAWPRFEMPVEVVAHQGDRTVSGTLQLSGDESVLRLELPGDTPPDRIEVDPDSWLLKGDVVYR